MADELTLENAGINRQGVQKKIQRFPPKTQDIFYKAYSPDLSTLPEKLPSGLRTDWAVDLLEKMSGREQELILMLHGVVTGTPMPVAEVAEKFGIVPDRVLQINRKYLLKLTISLRHMKNRRQLRKFLEE